MDMQYYFALVTVERVPHSRMSCVVINVLLAWLWGQR